MITITVVITAARVKTPRITPDINKDLLIGLPGFSISNESAFEEANPVVDFEALSRVNGKGMVELFTSDGRADDDEVWSVDFWRGSILSISVVVWTLDVVVRSLSLLGLVLPTRYSVLVMV